MYRCVPSIEGFMLHVTNKHNIQQTYTSWNKSRNKDYAGRKLVGTNVSCCSGCKNYKYFLPFCNQSDVTFEQKNSFLKAKLSIGFPPLNESYVSKVTMIYPQMVKAECTDGKLFNHLNTLWIFTSGLKNNPHTCVIDFSLSFEFKSSIHSNLSNLFFNEIVRQMEKAFIEEAKRRYGKPCIKTIRLER